MINNLLISRLIKYFSLLYIKTINNLRRHLNKFIITFLLLFEFIRRTGALESRSNAEASAVVLSGLRNNNLFYFINSLEVFFIILCKSSAENKN